MRYIDKRRFMHGRGPAPQGYVTCRDPKCNQRDWTTGRFLPIPNHFHPLRYDETSDLRPTPPPRSEESNG